MGSHTKEEILQEIERCNAPLKVAEVIKFGIYTHVFKVEFTTSEMASHTLENGVLLFNVKIAPQQIKREEHIDILMCFKCYKLDHHSTNECPTPDLVICSECSGNHNHRDCDSILKKCINCKGSHRTMAMACPLKKEIIKRKKELKEETERRKEETTYAKIVQNAVETVKQKEKEEDLGKAIKESGLRAYLMILDAHMQNLIEPGTYNSTLNETLQNNGIQPIKFRDNPDSARLFKCDVLGHTLISLREIEKQRKAQKSPERKRKASTSSNESSDMESEHNTTKDTQEEEIVDDHIIRIGQQETTANDCDVQIYVTESATLPKDLTPPEVTKLYNEQKLKYTIHANSKFSSENIEYLIRKQKISERKENIRFISQTQFRKIRNGPQKSPTKIESKKTKTAHPPLPKS